MDATSTQPSFADWLREQMIARGYKMEGLRAGGPSLLARQIGVHRATITRIFTNGAVPKPETLDLIGRQLQIPKTELLIAAGIANEDELAPSHKLPQPPGHEPEPGELFPGGLRDQHEETIWAMGDLPWQARHAAIDAMRREAKRLAEQGTDAPGPARRLA